MMCTYIMMCISTENCQRRPPADMEWVARAGQDMVPRLQGGGREVRVALLHDSLAWSHNPSHNPDVLKAGKNVFLGTSTVLRTTSQCVLRRALVSS